MDKNIDFDSDFYDMAEVHEAGLTEEDLIAWESENFDPDDMYGSYKY